MIKIRAVGVTLRAFDPLAGAKLSMCTALSLGRKIPRKGSHRGLNRLANVIHQALDQRRVVALGHHADQGLGSRLADDEPAAPLELGFGGCDALPDAVVLERLGAAVEADVLQHLWPRLKLAPQLP